MDYRAERLTFSDATEEYDTRSGRCPTSDKTCKINVARAALEASEAGQEKRPSSGMTLAEMKAWL